MPATSEDDPPRLVCVVDSSTIINVKTRVSVDEQWAVLTQMGILLGQGRLAFPRQVRKEIAGQQHPDAPGAWIAGAWRDVQFSQPTDTTMAEILEHTQALVDPNSEVAYESADPYVAAMAYELARHDPPVDVVVATDDVVDRPPLISLGTACDRLEIIHWPFETFLQWVNESRA